MSALLPSTCSCSPCGSKTMLRSRWLNDISLSMPSVLSPYGESIQSPSPPVAVSVMVPKGVAQRVRRRVVDRVVDGPPGLAVDPRARLGAVARHRGRAAVLGLRRVVGDD